MIVGGILCVVLILLLVVFGHQVSSPVEKGKSGHTSCELASTRCAYVDIACKKSGNKSYRPFPAAKPWNGLHQNGFNGYVISYFVCRNFLANQMLKKGSVYAVSSSI